MDKQNAGAAGMITGIGHGTTRDGPGRRSIIYFKGCNFRCSWCGSPETQSSSPDLMLYPAFEKFPARAAASCPHGAISISESGHTETDRTKCAGCNDFTCVKKCLDGSREQAGFRISADEVFDEVIRYRRFFANYGVTVSGGEAALQWEFFVAMLERFKKAGLHTAVETNASIPRFREAIDLIDLVIADFKHPDPDAHAAHTGASNETVLENIRLAAGKNRPLWIRIPLTPGVNDGPALDESADTLFPLRNRAKIEILGYHRLGVPKWKALGRQYHLEAITPPAEREIENARLLFLKKGFDVIRT